MTPSLGDTNLSADDGVVPNTGGELPDRFTTGGPGTSELFHTTVCCRVKAAMKNRESVRSGVAPTKKATDRTIEVCELRKCPSCERLEGE